MAEARDLLIRLTVDAAQADKRLKDIAKSTGNLEKSLSGAGSALKGFAAGLAGTLTIGAMVTGMRAAANAMDEMAKASQKIGVSTESLSALNYAAKQSGVSFEGLQTGLKKLNQNLADVDKGTTDAAKAMRALGVTGADSPQEAISKIADAFASVPDSAQKTALAMSIFGKAGADLIPMLNSGAAGLKSFEDRAKQLGIIISSETAKQAEKFNDSLADMQAALGGVVKQITAGALPGMSGLVAALADGAKASESWQKFGRGLAEVLGFVVGIGIKATATFQALGTVIAGVGAAAVLAASGEFKAAGRTFKQMVDDVNGIEASTNARLAGLRDAMAGVGQAAPALTTAAGSTQRFSNAVKQLSEESKKAGERLKAFENLIKNLSDELEKLKLTDVNGQLSKYSEILAQINSGTLKLTEAEKARALELAKAIDAQKQQNDALKQQNDILKEAWQYVDKSEADQKKKDAGAIIEQVNALNSLEEKYRAILDPMYEMRKSMSEIDELFYSGRINADEWGKLIKRTTTETVDMMSNLKDAIDGYAKDMAGAFVSAVASGEGFKDAFKSITASFLQNIAQMIMQIGVIEPMMKRLKASMSGTGGGGIGSWISGLFGFAHGGAFAGATGLPYGVYNSPTFFPMPGSGPLKKFATGGVLGEAGPEAILPLRRGSSGRLGVEAEPANVNVNVINNAGAEVSVSQDTNGDTTILIEKAKRAIANDIRRGGNDVASAIEGTYRVSRGG